jgi:hypothetical protein
MLVVTYISVWAYNFVANRQVRNPWLCDMLIIFSLLQKYKRPVDTLYTLKSPH